MPADADLLCEYYILSNLNKKQSLDKSANAATSFIPAQTKLNPNDLSTYSAIEFVKYDKNPMDALKSKYQLMSCGSSPPAPQHNSTATTNGYSYNTAPAQSSTISVKEQPAASSIAHNTQVASSTTSASASCGQATAAASSSSLAPSASKSSGWLDLNWSRIRKIGIGLINLGNNCYLNATLQCLAYTAPLSQWLVLARDFFGLWKSKRVLL